MPPQVSARNSAADQLSELIANHGFAMVQELASRDDLERLRIAIEAIDGHPHARARQGSTYGVRNLLQVAPEVLAWAESESVLDVIRTVLGAQAVPVKGILFDKTELANWAVPWHQDVTISVRQRCEVPGWDLWSEKGGIPHVQPPVEVLQQVLALRLHLDPCPAQNGALRVLPGSHRTGRLSESDLNQWRSQVPEVVCPAEAGDALLMRPLLLHASASSKSPTHRRVVHIEYSAISLPEPLEWGC